MSTGLEWMGLKLVLMLSMKDAYGPLRLYANELYVHDIGPLWLEKARRALALIEEVAPATARRLYRDVDSILLDAIRGPSFLSSIRAIRIHGPSIQHLNTFRVALIIVHEATHARIASRGIPYASDQRARHEALCTKAEVRFAKKVPRAADSADELVDKLDTPWWTDEALRNRELVEFDRLRIPGRLGRFLRRRLESRRPRN